MAHSLSITITSPNGAKRKIEFSASELRAASGALVKLAPTEIAEIKVSSQKVTLDDLAKWIDLVPGEVDLETELHAETRSAIEARCEFPDPDTWEPYEFSDLPYEPRYVLIEGANEPVWVWLTPTNTGHAPIFVKDECPVITSELAEHSWFSDGGGAPVSWNGEAKLYQLPGGLFFHLTTGDVQEDAVVAKADTSEAAILDQLVEFCCVDGRLIDAAFALESTDDDQVAQMVTDLQQYSGIDFQIDEAMTIQLRKLLFEASDGYRAVKEFLENPRLEKHQMLFQALSEVPDLGVTGNVNGSYPDWYAEIKRHEKLGKK